MQSQRHRARTSKNGKKNGELAQLARALAWHARGHEFDSRILHSKPDVPSGFLFISLEITYLKIITSTIIN